MTEANLASIAPTRKPDLGSHREYEIFPAIPTIRTIMQLVAWKYGLEYREIIGCSRRDRVVWARYVAIHAAYRLTGATVMLLGREFRRNHTTISHALGHREGRGTAVFLQHKGASFERDIQSILNQFYKGA